MIPAAFPILLLLNVPLAPAGLVLMNAGFARTRAVSHLLYASLAAIAIASFAFFAIGFAWQGAPGIPGHVISIGGSRWDWIGSGPFFFRGFQSEQADATLAAVLGLFSVGLCAMIPVFAGAERWRLGPTLVASALTGGFVFPVFAHAVWGGGWLAQLGREFHLGRGFIDAGGSACVHSTGALIALSVVWVLGPRRGKYNASGLPSATPGHNAAFILAGCFFAFEGWLALNCAGALLFNGVPPSGLALVAVNSFLAAIGGIISSSFITRVRFGKPDASLSANGWIAGLVAVSAGCAFLKPPEAMLVGLISGTLVVFSVELLELHLKIDDPCGAISVHGAGGIWGVVAAGLFLGPDQLTAQLIGLATLLGLVFPVSYGLNLLVNRFLPYRVSQESERQGVDLAELGAGAYPEFMIHRDDFTLR
ncbi:MAG: ammonium transporter [Acidobacteriaceae bacterium]|nr:ammonium transporter [Acidobacteriaceae bacterium]